MLVSHVPRLGKLHRRAIREEWGRTQPEAASPPGSSTRSCPTYGIEMAQASTFAAWPSGANNKPPGLFVLSYNLFSGPDRPVARNIK